MGEFMGTREASEKWGCHQYDVSKWCREGLIPNAEQDKPRSPRRIPSDTKCPFKIKEAKNK